VLSRAWQPLVGRVLTGVAPDLGQLQAGDPLLAVKVYPDGLPDDQTRRCTVSATDEDVALLAIPRRTTERDLDEANPLLGRTAIVGVIH
jgi:hypothetical protein